MTMLLLLSILFLIMLKFRKKNEEKKSVPKRMDFLSTLFNIFHSWDSNLEWINIYWTS